MKALREVKKTALDGRARTTCSLFSLLELVLVIIHAPVAPPPEGLAVASLPGCTQAAC